MYIDNAKNLWDEIQERFSKSNHFHISNLLQETNLIKQIERTVTKLLVTLTGLHAL